MTEQSNMGGPGAGQNLLVLKGIVWGLGVLLILGTALLAIKMANLSTQPAQTAAPSQTAAYTPTVADMAALSPLPLRAGEMIVDISAGEGLMMVILEDGSQDQVTRRVLTIPIDGSGPWAELPTRQVAE